MNDWLVLDEGTLDAGVFYWRSPWWKPWRRRAERRAAAAFLRQLVQR